MVASVTDTLTRTQFVLLLIRLYQSREGNLPPGESAAGPPLPGLPQPRCRPGRARHRLLRAHGGCAPGRAAPPGKGLTLGNEIESSPTLGLRICIRMDPIITRERPEITR